MIAALKARFRDQAARYRGPAGRGKGVSGPFGTRGVRGGPRESGSFGERRAPGRGLERPRRRLAGEHGPGHGCSAARRPPPAAPATACLRERSIGTGRRRTARDAPSRAGRWQHNPFIRVRHGLLPIPSANHRRDPRSNVRCRVILKLNNKSTRLADGRLSKLARCLVTVVVDVRGPMGLMRVKVDAVWATAQHRGHRASLL